MATLTRERTKRNKPGNKAARPAQPAAEQHVVRNQAEPPQIERSRASQAERQVGPQHVESHAPQRLSRRAAPAAAAAAAAAVPAFDVEREILDFEQLNVPTLEQISAAYQAIDFPNAFSDQERIVLENESDQRYRLQLQLRENREEHYFSDSKLISDKKAMGYGDEALVKQAGKIHTDSAYLDCRYALIENRYYSLLPVAKLRALSRDALFDKLSAEYAKEDDQRDAELISFFQNLIYTKDMEEEAGLKKKKVAPEHPPVEVTEDEKHKNLEAVQRNHEAMFKREFLDGTLFNEKLDTMISVMGTDKHKKFWKNKDTKTLNPAQIEGVRSILAFLYRNCDRTGETKEPFVHTLATASPGQLMYMFYMLENDMAFAPDTQKCFEAVKDYVPDLDNFKSKVMSSKAAVWKQVSSDMYIDWSMMGVAARAALNCDVPDKILDMEATVEAAAQRMKAPGLNQEQRRAVGEELLHQKTRMLLGMYRTAGLSPEMPPSLIKDPSLRRKAVILKGECDQFMSALMATRRDQVRQMGANARQRNRLGAATPATAAKKANKPENVGRGVAVATSQVTGPFVNVVSDGNTIGDTIGGGILGLASFAGLIEDLIKADGVRKAFSTDDRLGHAAKAMTVTGKALGDAAKVASGGLHVAEQFTTVSTAGTAAAAVALGSASAVAGGIMITAGALEIRHAAKAKETAVRTQYRLQAFRQANGKLNAEGQMLERFLTHSKTAATDKEVSGGAKCIGGTMALVGGILTATGVGAPVGLALSITGAVVSIGIGMIGGRMMRAQTQKEAVDDFLGVEKTVKKAIAQNPGMESRRIQLKNEIRQEMLGRRGYATYKECFSDLCKSYAELLYRKVFLEPQGTPEHQVYMDALSTLGLKIKIDGDKSIPTAQSIYDRLMK